MIVSNKKGGKAIPLQLAEVGVSSPINDENIFTKTSVSSLPLGADLRFYFPCDQPKGTVNLRFAQGKKDSKDSLIWELQMQGAYSAVKSQQEIIQWCVQAHETLEYAFFGMLQEVFLRRLE